MHLVHAHLQKLDQNSTQFKSELGIVLDLAANMTNDIAQIQAKLQKISESIEAAPTIAQLPKDVEDLKKIVADLGAKSASDDKEGKLAREQQASNGARLIEVESKLKLLEGNISLVSNLTTFNSRLGESVTHLQNDMTILATNVTDFKALLTEVNNSQRRLDEWRLLVQDRVRSLNDTTLPTNVAATVHNSIAKKELDKSQLSNATGSPEAFPGQSNM